jgi:hypothetical protein
VKDIHATALIERLADGWAGSHIGPAQELMERWAAALCTEVEINEVGENTAQFVINLSDIRLRTMYQVPCMLVSGNSGIAQPLQSFWNKFNSTKYIPFVLTLSETARAEAAKKLNSGRCLILSAEQIKQMLHVDLAQNLLKQIIHQQIPRRALIPYSILVPAEGGMFFGREHELSRLLNEDFNSFAIAGPGRLGKTSLMLRYKEMGLRERQGRTPFMHCLSFHNGEPLPNRTARFLAMGIEPSRRSDRITAGDLVNFLRYQKNRYGGTIELLLDEVDEVCQGEVFKYLGEAARSNLCRLVLCGKGVLLKMMLSSKSPLDCRLDLLQLGPLDEKSARALLIEPLTDLDFRIDEPDKLVGEVLELTGHLPNLIQLFGMKLADRAIMENADPISLEHLDALKKDFFIAQFFIKALVDLDDPETRLVGLSLLNESKDEFSVREVQEVARREGISADAKRTNDMCIDLLINNVLVWDNGAYRIATGGLSFYARQKDYLTSALEDARRETKARPPATGIKDSSKLT